MTFDQIKSHMNECARVMNEIACNEDAIDFMNDLQIIMQYLRYELNKEIYSLSFDDACNDINWSYEDVLKSIDSLNKYHQNQISIKI